MNWVRPSDNATFEHDCVGVLRNRGTRPRNPGATGPSEDIWKDEVCECLQETGSEMLVSPNGSPFDWPKPDQRMNVAVARVKETSLPLLYLNQVGGQDELVFDGASFVLNATRPRRAAAGTGRRPSVSWRCGARAPAGAASRPSAPCSRNSMRPPTTPACWVCETTSTRTVSPAS